MSDTHEGDSRLEVEYDSPWQTFAMAAAVGLRGNYDARWLRSAVAAGVDGNASSLQVVYGGGHGCCAASQAVDAPCLLLADCTAEPGMANISHEASLSAIQHGFGWVAQSSQFIGALEEQHAPSAA